MESHEVSEDLALHIVRRMCKAISKTHGTEVKLQCNSKHHCCLFTSDREIVTLKIFLIDKRPVFMMEFLSVKSLLEKLMNKDTCIIFSPFGRFESEMICTSAMFGTTVEEVMTNLDLFGI